MGSGSSSVSASHHSEMYQHPVIKPMAVSLKLPTSPTPSPTPATQPLLPIQTTSFTSPTLPNCIPSPLLQSSPPTKFPFQLNQTPNFVPLTQSISSISSISSTSTTSTTPSSISNPKHLPHTSALNLSTAPATVLPQIHSSMLGTQSKKTKHTSVHFSISDPGTAKSNPIANSGMENDGQPTRRSSAPPEHQEETSPLSIPFPSMYSILKVSHSKSKDNLDQEREAIREIGDNIPTILVSNEREMEEKAKETAKKRAVKIIFEAAKTKPCFPFSPIADVLPFSLLNKQPEAITHEDKLTVLFIFSELAKLAIGNAKNFQSTPKMKLPAEFIEKFGTGVHVIDKQHKLLFELFSFLTAVKGNAIQFSNEILLGVFEYSLLHEQFEENLMQIHHVPSFFEHQREHQVLIEIISMTIQEMKQSSNVLVLEARMKRISSMLFNWLENHLKGCDKQMCDWLIRKGIVSRF
eukprot:TRINITY_DN353_c0_g2_i2.p1 TRINITY_DN353_c0_g2~~TRINITY_DN353_c0_g2_i2.p1  ORF type:complete len:465 (-),score=150.14 TRINITY_DN353_c0_g2_i2:44-1438(-)